MNRQEPVGELHPGFSVNDATATPWAEARSRLEDADLAWLTTVRPDGRPHTTPLIFVWLDDFAYFTTGPSERKAKNLASSSHCIITTGCNVIDEGLDVVVEGEAVLVSDSARLQQVAESFAAKYLPRDGAKVFHSDLRDGTFIAEDGTNLLYEVRPRPSSASARERSVRPAGASDVHKQRARALATQVEVDQSGRCDPATRAPARSATTAVS